MKLYLRKNDNNIDINKSAGDDKLPYFSLFIVPEEKEGAWVEIGAFWKSKSGKGYNGRFQDKKFKVEITGLSQSEPTTD